MTVERVADTTCEIGENPLWHPGERVVYWCDIPTGELFKYDPASDTHESAYDADRAIGGFTIQADGSLLLFGAGGRVERLDGGSTTTVIESIPEERDSRFNDVIADPRGRVFAGTMPTDDRLGRLYRVDSDGSYRLVYDGLDIPNGMGFSRGFESIYVTESEAHTVHVFDYDESNGEITNRSTFLSTPDEPGVPDGMTVDASGDIWSARWNGNELVRYAADGTEKARFEFPARKVSSVTFGGDDYGDIYVTTAGGDDRDAEGDGAGALFRVRTDAQGREEFRSNVRV